jgi:hypothetical protein
VSLTLADQPDRAQESVPFRRAAQITMAEHQAGTPEFGVCRGLCSQSRSVFFAPSALRASFGHSPRLRGRRTRNCKRQPWSADTLRAFVRARNCAGCRAAT